MRYTENTRIIGAFGLNRISDIPRVVLAAVQARPNLITAVTLRDDLEGDGWFYSGVEFQDMVSRSTATRFSDPLEWLPDTALYCEAASSRAQLMPLPKIEANLNKFVESCRIRGKRAFRAGQPADALDFFDRARRVSNDPDDYIGCLYSNSNLGVREVWSGWLSRYAPNTDIHLRAVELGLVRVDDTIKTSSNTTRGQRV
jgi:hypothetical protein